MTFEELDVALEELETRLERLRALYEQYFLGFEKIEPSVARKDVDRRIYVLRREKIRNTGKRFKLQTIIQRYNTFQQYWQRICREIENGTYKRHLLLAKKQMDPGQQLTIASRRRFGKLVGPALASEPPPGSFPAEEAATIARPNQLESDDEELATRRPPPLAPERSVEPEEGTERVAPPPKPAAPPKPARPAPPRTEHAVPPKPGARPLSSQPPPRSPTAPKYDSLDMDMGFLGSWAPPPPPGKAPAAPPRAAPPPAPKPPAPAPAVATPAASPAEPPPRPKSPPRPAPPPPPRAAPPPKPAGPPPAAPPRAATLSDDRVKDLHDKLSELKKQNREAGQVSLESLKKTLRETESKLREKHQGRKIDFEVVVRDGKAIVKPTVR